MKLREFLYLDAEKVDQYLSQAEDGLRSTATKSNREGRSGSARVDAKIVSADLGTTGGAETGESRVDTPMSRFDRLTSIIAGHHDEVGWIEAVSAADVAAARPRSFLELDVELSELEELSLIRPEGGLGKLAGLAGIASALGAAGAKDMPSGEQIQALSAFGESVPARLFKGVALADEDVTVFGLLQDAGNPRAMDGEARVVGKVRSLLPAGEWVPAPNMPFYVNMPRAQRRDFAKKGPQSAAGEKLWIKGPAIELDLIAIWN